MIRVACIRIKRIGIRVRIRCIGIPERIGIRVRVRNKSSGEYTSMRKSRSDRYERPRKKSTTRKAGTCDKSRADTDTSTLRLGDRWAENGNEGKQDDHGFHSVLPL